MRRPRRGAFNTRHAQSEALRRSTMGAFVDPGGRVGEGGGATSAVPVWSLPGHSDFHVLFSVSDDKYRIGGSENT